MRYLNSRDVVCPVCCAAPGQPCIFVNHPDPAYRGATMRRGHHTDRRLDAHEAQRMREILIDE